MKETLIVRITGDFSRIRKKEDRSDVDDSFYVHELFEGQGCILDNTTVTYEEV